MITYDIVEVSKDLFMIGTWKTRWFRKPKFIERYGCQFSNMKDAINFVERQVQSEKASADYPRHHVYGYVANDGKFHELRDCGW